MDKIPQISIQMNEIGPQARARIAHELRNMATRIENGATSQGGIVFQLVSETSLRMTSDIVVSLVHPGEVQ